MSRYVSGLSDVVRGVQAWHIWLQLGARDVTERYRRTILGPWWMTLSALIFVASLGLVYSMIFGVPIGTYLPYLAAGVFAWQYLTSFLVEPATVYPQSSGYILNFPSPLSVFLLRVPTRNSIILFHNLLAWLAMCVVLRYPLSATALLTLPGVLLVTWALVPAGVLVAAMCARFRDLAVAIGLGAQLLFFVSPVMWSADQIPQEYAWIIRLNPLVPLLNLIRQPLLGEVPAVTTWLAAIVMGTAIWLLAMPVHGVATRRVAFWL
jgi:ABC-type polysaccharide/polyol phosphate export permease